MTTRQSPLRTLVHSNRLVENHQVLRQYRPVCLRNLKRQYCPVDPAQQQDMSEEDKYADNPFIEILRELPQSKAEVDFKSFTAMFPTKLSGQANWRQWLFALENVTGMHDLGPILNPGMDSLVESAVNFENADDQQATREYAVSLTIWADRFFRQVLSVIVVETHLEIVISAPTGGAAFRQLHALFGKVSPITIAELREVSSPPQDWRMMVTLEST